MVHSFGSIYFIFICSINSVNKRWTKDRRLAIVRSSGSSSSNNKNNNRNKRTKEISPTNSRLFMKREKLFNDLNKQLIHQTTTTTTTISHKGWWCIESLSGGWARECGGSEKKNEKSFLVDFHTYTHTTPHNTTQMCHQFKICHLIEFPLQISKLLQLVLSRQRQQQQHLYHIISIPLSNVNLILVCGFIRSLFRCKSVCVCVCAFWKWVRKIHAFWKRQSVRIHIRTHSERERESDQGSHRNECVTR